MKVWKRCVLALVLSVVGFPPDGLEAQDEESWTSVRWWHPVAAGAGVAALFLLDEPVQTFIQDNRSSTLDDVADVAKTFKEPAVFFVSGGGAILVGVAANQPKVARTGLQIIAAYGLSSAMMIGTKWLFGRSRPSATPDDPANFDWYDGGASASFPSGSATIVFSLATTLADAIDHPVASVVLYSGAAANAWARLNDDRHWLSDVALGALYGVTAAKLVNGHWRIFGVRPPTVLVGPDGTASLGYSVSW